MTSAPADLLALRNTITALTGLSPNAVGIVGDGAHQRTGGFHEGRDVLASIGRYHGPATSHIGSTAEDYSARAARDRQGLTNHASALDIGDNWPRGGRAAWLRFNNALYQELRWRPSFLPALRAINVTLDGSSRRRYDTAHPDAGLIPSTDTVTIHTHLEFWRDTEGRRQATLDRITTLINTAITGGTTMAWTDQQYTDAYEWLAGLMGIGIDADGRRPSERFHAVSPYHLIQALQADVTAIRAAGPASLSDTQVTAIAGQVAAAVVAHHDALTDADTDLLAPVIEESVKDALRTGTA